MKGRTKSIRSLVRDNAAARRYEITHKPKVIQTSENNEDEQYKFKDISVDLAAKPGTLEIHPTRAAPTLDEAVDEVTRDKDKERMKFFSVPIKIYESELDDSQAQLNEFTEKDREELHRYGSRVVMNKQGHVIALEVRKDVMKRFKPKAINADFCQCKDIDYEVSENLRNQPATRRMFISKILFTEVLIKLPSVPWLLLQQFITPFHDFLYEQTLSMFLIWIFLVVARLVLLCLTRFTEKVAVHRILLVSKCLSQCLCYSLATVLVYRYCIYYVQHNQYEDPTSLSTLKKKLVYLRGINLHFYPYFGSIMVLLHVVQNIILCGILNISTKIMNENGNGYLLVIIMSHGFFLAAMVVLVLFCGLIQTPDSYDGIQIVLTLLILCKWVMWRFYLLKELVKGKIRDVHEKDYQQIALGFAC